MKTKCTIMILAIACMIAFSESSIAQKPQSAKSSCCDLKSDMRKLWEDHIIWTRLFIISAAADLPDKAAATDRLLQNQADIGNAHAARDRAAAQVGGFEAGLLDQPGGQPVEAAGCDEKFVALE